MRIHICFAILAYMKLFLLCLLLPFACSAQTEDDFFPEVRTLVMDSSEKAAMAFCKEVITAAPGYKFAFADREDIMMSKYFYDNGNYETIKFEFQFVIEEQQMPDSTVKKNRVVRFMTISAELSAITNIYNYIFNSNYTPDKIMAISRYDKPVSYKGASYNSSIVADDMKVGYWILSFFRL